MFIGFGLSLVAGITTLEQRVAAMFVSNTGTPAGYFSFLNALYIIGNTVTSTGPVTIPDGTTLTPNSTTNWIII